MAAAPRKSSLRPVVGLLAALAIAFAGYRVWQNRRAAAQWNSAAEAADAGRYDDAIAGYRAARAAGGGLADIARDFDAAVADAHHRRARQREEGPSDPFRLRDAAADYEKAADHLAKANPDAAVKPAFGPAEAYLDAAQAYMRAYMNDPARPAGDRDGIRRNAESALRVPGVDATVAARAKRLAEFQGRPAGDAGGE